MKILNKKKILFDILHPAHCLKFRDVIKKLKEQGHEVIVTAREKDVTCDLLGAFGIPYIKISKIGNGKVSLLFELILRNLKLLKICLDERPDVLVGYNGISIAQVGWLLKIPSVYVTENEDAKLLTKLGIPFATTILTEKSFKLDYGVKHKFIDGFFEQTYLSDFIPNPKVLEENGLKKGEPFSFVRFVAWKATHDIGEKGFSWEQKIILIQTLKEYGRVLISSEDELPKEFKSYEIKSAPEDVHSLIHYAKIYVGDSQVMANEAGILGTPAIRCNSLVNTMHAKGKFDAMEKLHRVYSISNPNVAIDLIKVIYGDKKPLLKNHNTVQSIIKAITTL